MLFWILILGGLLIMMGHHARAEALYYYFRLEDPDDRSRCSYPSVAAAQNGS
jgi:hypothetical protein